MTSQRDGAFMRVVTSGGRVAISCMWLSLVVWRKPCWVLRGALKRFRSLSISLFVTLIRATLHDCVSPLPELPMCSGLWFPLFFQLESVSPAKSDWPTICGFHSEHPRQGFLKLHHPWIQKSTVETVPLIWITVIGWTRNRSPAGFCFWVGSPDPQGEGT